MRVCIAGKNNIAIDIIQEIRIRFPKIEVFAIPNKNDIGKNKFQRSFLLYCKQNKIKIVTLNDIYHLTDLIFISLEFDKIIDVDRFKTSNLFNIHFSLLPKYKGMYTSAWPLLNGECMSGVTFHRIDKGIDTGNIIYQRDFKIDDCDNSRDLYLKYISEGTLLIKTHLDQILNLNFTESQQNARYSTYYSKSSINYSKLTINLNCTAFQIQNQIRAFTFRDYQIPLIYDYEINRCIISDVLSTAKSGTVIEDTSEYIKLATIDYDIVLYKDYFKKLLTYCADNNLEELIRISPYIVNWSEQDSNGWTPLIVAAYNNSLDVVKYLLDRGASVDECNYNGTTVLMYAKSGAINTGDVSTFEYLCSFDPNFKACDINGLNIYDYALRESQIIVDIIKRYSDD